MKRALLFVSMSLLACAVCASPALAAHVNCGDVLTQDTRLDSDLLNCPGNGLVIGADTITVNLAGHTIDGTGAANGGNGIDNDEGHDGVTVRRGRIQDFQAGVYLDRADGGLLRGLTITNTGSAFTLFNSDSNTMERNTVYSGIALYADCDFNTIDRNTSVTAGTSVLMIGFDTLIHPDGNAITRNRLTGAAGESYGVYVSASDDTLIEGNHIQDHGGTGISLNTAGPRNRVQGNTVSRTSEGIALDGSLTDTVIQRNRVTDSAGDGIRLSSLTSRTLVERNTVVRNGDDGIDADVSSATITRNTANFNVDFGIEAVAGVTDGGGNRARGNGNPAQCLNVNCR